MITLTDCVPGSGFEPMTGFRWVLAFLFLTACSNPLNMLTGGGPNVAANVQAGAENNQTVGVSNKNDVRIVRPEARSIEASTGETGVRAEKVHTVVVEAAPNWVWVLICGIFIGMGIGWTIETPHRMIFGRRNDGTE